MMAAHSTLSEKTSSRFAPTVPAFERICQVIVLLMGARCAFAGRNLPVGADGVAYLDVARSYLRLDWHTAINGYWGPLYSWLLAIGMRFFHSGIRTEFAMARALNFVLFAAAVYTFSRFWRALAEWSRQINGDESSIPYACPTVWIGLGYLLFVVNFIWHVDEVTPDILVAAIVFAIAASLFKVNFKFNDNRQHSIAAYVWLGLLLAVGYYAKAILLYFAVFVLGAMVVQGFRSSSLLKNSWRAPQSPSAAKAVDENKPVIAAVNRCATQNQVQDRLFQRPARIFRGPITAIIVFVVLVSPFVAILSRTVGHFTAGDAGRLNYAWFVDGPETKTWMKVSYGAAPLPFYPGSVALDAPRVFRLPSIDGVTYAPWYDAARFDKRSHPAFDLRAQLRQLAVNLPFLKDQIFGAGAALLVPLLILVWYAPRASLRHFAATWFCTLPAAAVVGMYLLVHLVQRFVLGFSLLLWGAAWASVLVPPGLQLLARRAMLAGTLVFAAYMMPGLLHYVVSQRTGSAGRDMAIAEAISHHGIEPGDVVASIGDGQEAYWAQLARVLVVAEVWSIDASRFWSAQPDVQQAVLRSMADAGAKAVVWRADSDQPCPPRWLSLADNSGCMISLH